MTRRILVIKLLKEKYGICSLNKTDAIPGWAEKGNFSCITRTEDELSVLCQQEYIPDGTKCEKEWRSFKIEGPLDLSEAGIISRLSTILAHNAISILTISAYFTTYIFVQHKDADLAVRSLSEEGYDVKVLLEE